MPNGRNRPTRTDENQVEYIREVIKASCKVLQQPTPDTFLGRKTHEPFPQEDQLQLGPEASERS